MNNSEIFLKNCPSYPGVYQMFNASGDILYVGKAQNLKNRLSSYFRQSGMTAKTQALMSQVDEIKLTITHSDTEALILECTLIKAHLPPYNILLRDDKSMPFIRLATEHEFPSIGIHRGKKEGNGRYFGPFPSSGAVYETLDLLQKIFQLRTCSEMEFNNRSRPCLLHQVKRCSAPCVGTISREDYAEGVNHVAQFLAGKSHDVIDAVTQAMDAASANKDYEKAALYRDQMIQLRRIQEKQYVATQKGDADVIALAYQSMMAVVYRLKIREGQLLGGYAYFPTVPLESSLSDILLAFIMQFYLSRDPADIPPQIILDQVVEDKGSLIAVLSEVAGRKVELLDHVKTDRAQWQAMARLNAQQALSIKLASKASIQERYFSLRDSLDLASTPNRIECFDISHTMGEATIAACVVFNEAGPVKSNYRRYSITGITGGDDYAALKQAFLRRYSAMKEKGEEMPEIVLVDGGKGQLTQLREVFKELGIQSLLLGLAKGTTRQHGVEVVYRATDAGQKVVGVTPLALHLLRQIDDLAHRFAITGHRKKREKSRLTSRLDLIEGIGKNRREQLLRFFGSLDVIKKASLEEIGKVPGISQALAGRVYQELHQNE